MSCPRFALSPAQLLQLRRLFNASGARVPAGKRDRRSLVCLVSLGLASKEDEEGSWYALTKAGLSYCSQHLPSWKVEPLPVAEEPAAAPPPKPPRFAAACPKGHREGLQLRRPADFPITGCDEDGDILETEEHPASVDWEADGEPGVTSGVWCSACEEWFHESECVHPCDDAGNPELPELGEAGRQDEEEDEDDPGSDDGEEDGSDGRP